MLIRLLCFLLILAMTVCLRSQAQMANIYLTEVPDYQWYAGCFGTACANLMGYWDRHGLPDFYTGPTAGGVAPLTSCGTNYGIRSLATTKAGVDGRPMNKPGHIDDYWVRYAESDCNGSFFSYESTDPDPYAIAGRAEHTPDCIGDFIGLSQRRWTNQNNECDGNIDAYSFVYWDSTGNRRTNFSPTSTAGAPARDIQSGLREWTRWRGYDADVMTQLTDFNPNIPLGRGFTFENMKAEIDAGFPVLIYLQPTNQFSRALTNAAAMPRANPEIHAILVHGYYIDGGNKYVHFRTSWGDAADASDPTQESAYSPIQWSAGNWVANLPARGVIAYHPKAKITNIVWTASSVKIQWEGPNAQLYDQVNNVTKPVSQYVIERAPSLKQTFVPVTTATTDHSATVTNCCGSAFFRVRLLTP